MLLFFSQVQPFLVACIAEIQLQQHNSDYEYASFSLACLFLVIILVSIVNTLILIIRHSSVSDHPKIILRFDILFAPFKHRSMISHLWTPIILSAKVGLVYVLMCTPKEYAYIISITISVAVRF